MQLRAARQSLAKGGDAGADGSTVLGGDTASGGNASGVLSVLGVISSQAVLITALLYYFGWVRAYSYLNYFGVDTSMAGYGAADYILRSINVAFLPFIDAAFTAMLLFGLHRLVVTPSLREAETVLTSASAFATKAVTDPVTSRPQGRLALVFAMYQRGALARFRPGVRGMRWFVGAVNAAGVMLALVVFTVILLPARIGVLLGLLLPLLLIAAVTLLGYVAHLRSSYPALLASPRPQDSAPASRAYTLTLLALGLIAAIWAVSLYGDQVGTEHAKYMVDHLREQPDITVYSTERVAITGPGVVADEITQPGTKYHYQYSGLRLLLHSSDKYLLLPVGWRQGQDRVFFLHDDDTIRMDITV
jgi:hypothetical protein